MGYPTVTWDGLKAWCSLMDVEIEAWEARAMVLLGCLRASIHAEKQSAEMKRKAKK